MLIAWLGDNNCSDWPVGLKFVQFSKNSSFHSGNKQSPYMALFGSDPRVGLRSTALPNEILERMVSEDDLISAFSQVSGLSSSSATVTNVLPPASSTSTITDVLPPGSSTSTVTDVLQPESTTFTVTDVLPPQSSTATDTDPLPSTSSSHLEASHANIHTQRKRARESLILQAERMVKRSRIDHAAGNTGDNVTVPIPLVDKGRDDPRNIMV